MNIKNEEAHAAARQLASLTGESVTTAVTVALRERLERLTAGTPDDPVAARKRLILHLAGEIREQAGPDPWVDHGDLLYDAEGLPR